jgi:hypothetical protein
MFPWILLLAAPASPPSFGSVHQDPAWTAVRAVLEANCLACHGGEARKSGLSFADRASFLEGGNRGPAIDAEQGERSRLLHAVRYGDPDLSMPPRGRLSARELELLEDWVRLGAPWPEGPEGRLADPRRHARGAEPRRVLGWAYQPLAESPPPEPKDRAWGRQPLDAFVRAGQEAAGFDPAPDAPPAVLLRRASFDLTGLPPTPEERERFLAEVERDGFERAWAALIDRLLASPHHGERWARHWLDLVRYAETNGYERDATKHNAWRYRDWVVRALNADLPYDRFVVAQLAGDEAPPEERLPADALLATGFFRLGVWDDEPSDPEQARADELADIVDAAGSVFLAATIGCARCHDHKADPISQAEYYGFTAFFNNLVGFGGGGFGQHLGGGAAGQVADLPGPGVSSAAEWNQARARLEAALAAQARRLELSAPDEQDGRATPLLPDARERPATWAYLEGQAPAGFASPAFDDGAWPRGPGGFGAPGTPGARVKTPWHGPSIALRTTFVLEEIPEQVLLTLHHDDDVVVFLNGVQILERRGYTTRYLELPLDATQRAHLVIGRNVLSLACVQDFGGQYIDAGLYAGVPGQGPGPEREEWLPALRAAAERLPAGAERERLFDLLAEFDRHGDLPRVAPYPAQIAREHGGVPPVQAVLGRGSVHAPGAEVEPAIPEAFLASAGPQARGAQLHAVDPGAQSTGRRLALARWLVGEGRSATARAMANRLWQFHFGRGLSRSPGDFGNLGVPPTHPELLDHLAARLIAQGWSLKAMHRELMTSRAYRMDSVGAASTRAVAELNDPLNDRLWRFDPRRLSAEEYRDALLASAGVLQRELFGPSIYPALSADVLQTASRPDQAWGRSSREQARRRSLYVFAKRSLQHPLLSALDQPSPDLPCPERFPTNVPTQALQTLNGAFPAEMAAELAARISREHQDRLGRLRAALAASLGREASEAELERQERFLERLETEQGLQPLEALSVFCLGLFNRNEFLWID